MLEVLGNRVAIMFEETEKTSGGLYVPQTVNNKGPKKGVVYAVSSGYYVGLQRATSDVKTGDVVLFDDLGASTIEHDGKKYLIVRNEDIIAVLQRSP